MKTLAFWILFVCMGSLGYSLWYLTDYTMDRFDQTYAYLALQGAYADSIMDRYDDNSDLAWQHVANNAHSATTILSTWMQRPPWMLQFRSHAAAINSNRDHIEFLAAKIESLEARP